MGGVSSYKKVVFNTVSFSSYFEGYGLYEDVESSIQVSKLGSLYLNTKAQLEHHHDHSGRPNYFKYGKMVVRNGWYVWRLSNPRPKFIHRIKWYSVSILLILIRGINLIQLKEPGKTLADIFGRSYGLITLCFNKPGKN